MSITGHTAFSPKWTKKLKTEKHYSARIARVFCAMLVVAAGFSISLRTDLQQVNAAPILFAESFTGRTTTGWISGGNEPACLTAGYESGGVPACKEGGAGGVTGVMPDPMNAGALRLTSNQKQQAGFVINNTNITPATAWMSPSTTSHMVVTAAMAFHLF